LGRKRIGAGKYVHFCIAVLTCLLLSNCAALDRSPLVQKLVPQDEPRQHLIRAQKLLAQGDYETALEENQEALSLSANSAPGDEALYNMALIYAHPGNPKKNNVKSIATFKRLAKEYPKSAWTEQGKVWTHLIQESENAKRAATTVSRENDKLKQENDKLRHENDKIKPENDKLKQENDKLKRMIEESRKVDLEIEEKKRDNVR
jgi:tetratricopeptide (TPR) repeat protein